MCVIECDTKKLSLYLIFAGVNPTRGITSEGSHYSNLCIRTCPIRGIWPVEWTARPNSDCDLKNCPVQSTELQIYADTFITEQQGSRRRREVAYLKPANALRAPAIILRFPRRDNLLLIPFETCRYLFQGHAAQWVTRSASCLTQG